LEYFEYGVKSDIWALGIMAYKMLSMTVPWKAKSNNDLILKIKQNPINTLL
jgi:serine/threonine protein kinase